MDMMHHVTRVVLRQQLRLVDLVYNDGRGDIVEVISHARQMACQSVPGFQNDDS